MPSRVIHNPDGNIGGYLTGGIRKRSDGGRGRPGDHLDADEPSDLGRC